MAVKTDESPVLLKHNPKVSTCLKCGHAIFYLELEGCDRVWWHEAVAMDFRHRAVPKQRRKNIDIY